MRYKIHWLSTLHRFNSHKLTWLFKAKNSSTILMVTLTHLFLCMPALYLVNLIAFLILLFCTYYCLIIYFSKLFSRIWVNCVCYWFIYYRTCSTLMIHAQLPVVFGCGSISVAFYLINLFTKQPWLISHFFSPILVNCICYWFNDSVVSTIDYAILWWYMHMPAIFVRRSICVGFYLINLFTNQRCGRLYSYKGTSHGYELGEV